MLVNRSSVVRLITSTAAAILCCLAVACVFLGNYRGAEWNSNTVAHGSKSKPSVLSIPYSCHE